MFLAWSAAADLDPRALSFPTAPEAYPFLGEGKHASNLKQIRAACRFDELIRLKCADCQAVGKDMVSLRIKGKGNIFQDVPSQSA